MSYDTIVVGGGIIGLSAGWRCAGAGQRVLVLDRDELAAGASTVAAGMLAPVTEATFGEQDLLALNLAGAEQWASFAKELTAESNVEVAVEPQGILYLATDADQARQLRRLYEFQQSLGLPVDPVGSSECRRLEPALHPSTRAGILAPNDGAVDPRVVLQALGAALRGAGGRIEYRRQVTGIDTGDRTGVRLADGSRLSARNVVLAAGCWSGRIDGVPARLGSAVRPVKGQILRLRHPQHHPLLLSRVLRTEEVYLVPRPDGEVVVGATVEEMGFDTRVTAGAVLELLRSADEVVPGIRELELTEASAGLRPGTPDNGPLLGPVEPGLIVATGHFRNGILLAPITAEAVAAITAGIEPPEATLPFTPGRLDR